MFRKTMILFFAMMLLCTSVASATGILPLLPTITAATEKAISFGVTVGKDAALSITTADGGKKMTYTDVSVDDYTAFSVRLGEEGYTLASQAQALDGLQLVVQKGALQMTLTYDQIGKTLSVLYPAGTQVESVNHFVGYKRLAPGETVKVPGVGNFTFKELHLGDEVKYSNTVMLNVWLEGTFENLSNSTLEYRRLFTAELHYVTADGHYTYAPWTYGQLRDDNSIHAMSLKSWIRGSMILYADSSDYDYASIRSLETSDFAIAFNNLPERIPAAKDGTIAVTLTLMGSDEQYVFYGREE